MTRKEAAVIVCGVGFISFFLELLISRLFMFYLGYFGSFFAVPYSLLGLSLGSFYYHFWKVKQQTTVKGDLLLLGIVSTFIFASFFWLSNTLLPVTDDPNVISLKMVVFGSMFLTPFFICGKIFSRLYSEHQAQIGNLYFLDFLGGAAACLALPFLFHFLSLPLVITILLCFILCLSMWIQRKAALIPTFLMGGILLSVMTGNLFNEKPDMKHVLASFRGEKGEGYVVEEIHKKWNEYARVSLLRISNSNSNQVWHRTVQDDGISNIYHVPYESDKEILARGKTESMILVLGPVPNKVLVMFAGCGKDMIILNHFFKAKAHITGIEINPLIKEMCLTQPQLASYRYQEFYDLPQINHVIFEGRSYLDQQDEAQYDLIFVGAQGSSATSLKQRSSRKYLNTVEAYEQYLNRLSSNGLLMFTHSYEKNRIRVLKRVHENRYTSDFGESVFVGRYTAGQLLIMYKKGGLTQSDRKNLLNEYAQMIITKPAYYVYGNEGSDPIYKGLVEKPFYESEKVLTDDRPYEYPISWKALFPKKLSWGSRSEQYIRLRVLSIFFISLLTLFLFCINAVGIPAEERIPKAFQVYLFLTGFAYMCLQIGLMGRLDLFLGNPLYSMALIIAIFVFSNGLGSCFVQNQFLKISIGGVFVVAIIGSGISYALADLAIKHFISLPLMLKLGVVFFILTPSCFILGIFFPYLVMLMKKKTPRRSVPAAYGLSVASSILGATFALLAVSNIGYRGLIGYAMGCYLVAILVVYLHKGHFAP